MLRRVVAVALAAAFIWPGSVSAQEDEGTPPMLVISSWKCDFANVGTIAEDWDMRALNAAQSAVDNSSWNAAGIFYHSWADEWNVNYWAVADDIPALLEGQEANNAAYDEMYGDGGTNLWDNCSEHKDGFYWLGKQAGNPPAPGPAMAISSWKCTDVGAVNDIWENQDLARAQAVVDSGVWTEAGVFYHAWAGEWNVNFYYMGEDIPSILAGWQSYMASMSDMGDDAPVITDYCTEHKDGFYEFGQTASASDDM